MPALQPHVARIVNYVKGKTWISAPFGSDKLSELLHRDPSEENCECFPCVRYHGYRVRHSPDTFTDEDKARFADPEYYKRFRHALDTELNVSDEPSTSLQCSDRRWVSTRSQAVYQCGLKDSAMQRGARAAFREHMQKALSKKPWIADDCGSTCHTIQAVN